jgi:hypothetical protein
MRGKACCGKNGQTPPGGLGYTGAPISEYPLVNELDRLVAEQVEKYGVTRCPEAYASHSTGEISAQDRAKLVARHAEIAQGATTALSLTGPSR